MNADYYRRQIQNHLKEISKLQSDKAKEMQKVADYGRKANSATQAATKSGSQSTRDSKLREASRHQDEVARIYRHIGDIESKIAKEQDKLATAQRNLSREEERETSNRSREEERRFRAQARHFNDITGRLSQHDSLHEEAMTAIDKLRQLPEQIVVLMLASNPLDQKQLRLDEEARSITEMIRKSKHRDAVKLESCWAVRPLDLLQAINEHKPRIVHFSGHGSDKDEIIFQDDLGNAKFVSKEAIIQTMQASAGNIQLVFFNTCYSSGQAVAVTKHVKAAIGMNTSVGDHAARVFSAQFYSAIGFGLSIKVAFEQAKAALMLEGIPGVTDD